MNEMDVIEYEALQVEVIEVEVEKGFSASGEGDDFNIK